MAGVVVCWQMLSQEIVNFYRKFSMNSENGYGPGHEAMKKSAVETEMEQCTIIDEEHEK